MTLIFATQTWRRRLNSHTYQKKFLPFVPEFSSVVSPSVTGVHALVFTFALAGIHALASVSVVVGSSAASGVAL